MSPCDPGETGFGPVGVIPRRWSFAAAVRGTPTAGIEVSPSRFAKNLRTLRAWRAARVVLRKLGTCLPVHGRGRSPAELLSGRESHLRRLYAPFESPSSSHYAPLTDTPRADASYALTYSD